MKSEMNENFFIFSIVFCMIIGIFAGSLGYFIGGIKVVIYLACFPIIGGIIGKLLIYNETPN